jgi:hypothetical protein
MDEKMQLIPHRMGDEFIAMFRMKPQYALARD